MVIMRNLSLLIWFSQLGLSVAVPLVGAVGLSVWLYNRFSLGIWVILLGVAVGLYGAVDGLRTSLKAMKQLAEQDSGNKQNKRNG